MWAAPAARLHRGLNALRVLLALGGGAMVAGAAEPAPVVAEAHAELQRQIEAILRRTQTPGAGVAIVRREGPEWIAGIGLADVSANVPATGDTLFRIGSTSKGFAALAILKLQEDGKLKLEDTVRSHAPTLAFENEWEETHPVRIVHLLEHTTGWDDLGPRDYASDPEQELTLAEGLALRPSSRRTRWRPGTRFAYSNVGAAVAAQLVENVTGQRFEDYVEQTWFRPLGMTTASYFGTPEVLSRSTKLYRRDGTTFPYWKISTRPSGAINASAREMANVVQFYLDRGRFGGVQLLPAAVIDRMERAATTYAAREGLGLGYGLGSYASLMEGRIYHGHNGGVLGGLTELAYLPEADAGYVVMINSGRGGTLGEICAAIRRHLGRNRPEPVKLPIGRVAPELAAAYRGWYEVASPRAGLLNFVTRLLTLSRISFTDTKVVQRPLNRSRRTWEAVGGRLFRRDGDPVPTLALIADQTEGTYIQTSTPLGGTTLRKVPTWQAMVQLGAVALAMLTMVLTLAFALVWGPRKLLGRMRGVSHLNVRVWPLLATLTLVGLGAIFPLTGGLSDFSLFGTISPLSVTVFALTLVFPAFAVVGLVQAVRHRRADIRRGVWWLAFSTALMMTVVAGYFAYWGVIGWRTWT